MTDRGGLSEQQAIVLGVALMLGGGLASSLLHVGVRYVSPQVPTIQIVAIRSLFTLLVTLPLLLHGDRAGWTTNNWPLQIARGLVGVSSMTTWYWALSVMPLGDAGVLSFTTAIFVTIGAALWFREPVGWRRWLAVAVGLAGAAVVLKPSPDALVSWGAIAAVGSSVLWAVSLLMAKELGKYDSSITISFFQPLMILPLAGAAAIPFWVWPDGKTWVILAGMGVVAAIGNYGYVHALRVADASITMPADYVRLIWMVSWGFFLFGEVPGATTWIGAALIIGSTLWISWREQRLARERGLAAQGKAA